MKYRAYIVEDSPTIRDNLSETLQELAEVELVGTADTEHEGKRWLAQNPDAWDVAIVDLLLRVGSGLHVVESVRQRRPNQKVIVLSNHATRDVRWRCQQLGADAMFDKSNEIDALVDFCLREREALGTREGRHPSAGWDPGRPAPVENTRSQPSVG